jgi:putative transposase
VREFCGKENHVHLLVDNQPAVAISGLASTLKGVSSRLLRRENLGRADMAGTRARSWFPSYPAGSSHGRPLPDVKDHIAYPTHANQQRPPGTEGPGSALKQG